MPALGAGAGAFGDFSRQERKKLFGTKKEKRLKAGCALTDSDHDARIIFLEGWGNQGTLIIFQIN